MQEPAGGQEGTCYMIELTKEEIQEMELAIAARSRANGSNTQPYKVCMSILAKLGESKRNPALMPSSNGGHHTLRESK